ncbi:hypothetical protein QP280_25305, partial [Escherichia coli]|nr:hypothetical protein [Escherichia coli]
ANVLLTPYLPESSQKVFETLGGEGIWAAMPEVQEVQDDMPVEPVGADLPAEGRSYPIITGDYVNQKAAWHRFDIEPGTQLVKPKPIFSKLDSELAE